MGLTVNQWLGWFDPSMRSQIIENNMNRICSDCKCEYEDYGQRCSLCKPCKRAYDRKYYSNQSVESKSNKQENQNARRRLVRQFLWDYLLEHPCITCGEPDPIVLEFDHIDRENKTGNIADLSKYSLSKVKEEIVKCRVLCANCHRRHTAIQFDWYKDIRC